MACCIAGLERDCVPCTTTLPALRDGVAQQLAFADVVRARLFDVHVLAGFERQERDGHVPVIGRGDRDGVDRAVVENAAEIGDALRAAGQLLSVGQPLSSTSQMPTICAFSSDPSERR